MQTLDLVAGLAGGTLIGLSASLLMLTHGEVAGISGLFSSVLQRRSPAAHRVAFLAGLIGVGLLLGVALPSAFGTPQVSLPVVAIAGLLVGLGARIGGGCTSGHGVCGLSRGSLRALVATCVFMATAVITVYATRATGLRGGP
jgi:uncharacterized membrane protein YedE/YeeE